MAVRILDQASSRETNLTASVCVVGAGIAGLIAAVRLARDKSRRVIVLESGLPGSNAGIDALNEIDNVASDYPGAVLRRTRGLGGTSLLWAGKLLPLSPHDIRPRPYLGLDGWPIDGAELEKYRAEIEAFMRVDTGSYEEDYSDRVDPARQLGRGDPEFVLRWPKRPTLKNHNLAHVFREEIKASENLEVWLGATVTRFDRDPMSGRVTTLGATGPSGHTLNVAADEFLIAAGTLESTRLLLLADRQLQQVITSKCDALGRYFNDHLGLNVARLRPIDAAATNRALSDRWHPGHSRHLHFELPAREQEAEGIGSAYFDIGVELSSDSSVAGLRDMLKAVKSGAPLAGAGKVAGVLRGLPDLARSAQWQFGRHQKFWPRDSDVQIKIWIEQLPCARNRISLSDQVDGLGCPKLRLDWTRTDADEKTFRVMVDRIRRFWPRRFGSICELEWAEVLTRPDVRLVDCAVDLAHPAGSTRMGTHPARSVVDADLRVHALPNVSVASASVFPTSGSANPTLTIMQLAMRASDALALRLR